MAKKPDQNSQFGDSYPELKGIEKSLSDIEKNKAEGNKEKIKQEIENITQACLDIQGKAIVLWEKAKGQKEKNKATALIDSIVDLKKTADMFKNTDEVNTEEIKKKLIKIQEKTRNVGNLNSNNKKVEIGNKNKVKVAEVIPEASAEDMARYGGKGEQKPPEKQEEVQVDNNIDSNKEENEKKEKEALIAAAKNKEDLFAALDKIGEVKGSSRTYSTEEIKDAIEALFAGVVIAGKGVTRELGIRDKAEELLKKEKTPKNKKDIIEKAENRKTINKEEFKKIIDEIKTAQGLIDFLNSAPGWIDAGDGLFNFADDKSVENNVKKVKEGFLVGFGKEYKAGYLPEILKNKIEEIRNSKKTRSKKPNTETVKSDNDPATESKPESVPTSQPESKSESKPEPKPTSQPDLVPKEKIGARQKIKIEKININKPSEGKEGIRIIEETTVEKPKADEVQKPTEKKKPFDRAAAFTSIIDFMDEREFKKQKKEVRGEIDAIRMMLEANNIDLLKKYFKNGNLEEDTENIFRADARFKWVFELMGETEEKKVEDKGVLTGEKGGIEKIGPAKAEIVQKAENESKKAQEYAAEIKKVQSEESDESKLKWLLNGALGIGKMAPNMVYKVVGTVLGFKAGTDLAMYAAGEALGKVTGKEHVWGDYAEHKKGEREIPEEQKRLYKLFDEYVASFRQAKLDKMEGKSDKEVTQNLKKSIAELYKFIDNNRYIDPKEKNLFKDRLNAIANDFNQENQEITEQQQEEVKKLAEAFLANKISKVQITRDWANFALACTPLTMLRIGTIAGGFAAERFRKGALEYNKKSKTEIEVKQESKFAHRLKFMTIDAAADWGAAIAGGHTRSTQKLENRRHGGEYDYDKQVDTLNEVKKELKNKTYEDYVEECKDKGIKALMEEKQFDDWKKTSLQKLTKKLSGTSMARVGVFSKAAGQAFVGAGLVGLAINADSLANVEWHDAATNFSNNVDKGLDALQLKPLRDLADRYWSGDGSSTLNIEISSEYDQIEKVRQLIYKDYGFDPVEALSQNVDINELGINDFIQLGKDLQELRETGVSVEAIRAIMADGIQEGELENLFQLADAFKENPDMLAQFNHHLEGGGEMGEFWDNMLVKKGDGITQIIARQIKADPSSFGIDAQTQANPDLLDKAAAMIATKIAKTQGAIDLPWGEKTVINEYGETRLLMPKNGETGLVFYNRNTGKIEIFNTQTYEEMKGAGVEVEVKGDTTTTFDEAERQNAETLQILNAEERINVDAQYLRAVNRIKADFGAEEAQRLINKMNGVYEKLKEMEGVVDKNPVAGADNMAGRLHDLKETFLKIQTDVVPSNYGNSLRMLDDIENAVKSDISIIDRQTTGGISSKFLEANAGVIESVKEDKNFLQGLIDRDEKILDEGNLPKGERIAIEDRLLQSRQNMAQIDQRLEEEFGIRPESAPVKTTAGFKGAEQALNENTEMLNKEAQMVGAEQKISTETPDASKETTESPEKFFAHREKTIRALEESGGIGQKNVETNVPVEKTTSATEDIEKIQQDLAAKDLLEVENRGNGVIAEINRNMNSVRYRFGGQDFTDKFNEARVAYESALLKGDSVLATNKIGELENLRNFQEMINSKNTVDTVVLHNRNMAILEDLREKYPTGRFADLYKEGEKLGLGYGKQTDMFKTGDVKEIISDMAKLNQKINENLTNYELPPNAQGFLDKVQEASKEMLAGQISKQEINMILSSVKK